jgi:hypothetical protein
MDAVFALDPKYMEIDGEDSIGFRCLAQRSRLADEKDGGVVAMFPQLAAFWCKQVQAQSPWRSLEVKDFERLKQSYGVSWVVLQQSTAAGLDCTYKNDAVKLCRIP